MKKILGTLLLGLTLLTGCVDSNNSYEELKPFLPGLNLYQNCQMQTTLALQPANVGMRLAILLAETRMSRSCSSARASPSRRAVRRVTTR